MKMTKKMTKKQLNKVKKIMKKVYNKMIKTTRFCNGYGYDNYGEEIPFCGEKCPLLCNCFNK